MHGRGARAIERAVEVHGEHGLPLFLRHVEDHPVAQDARDVDEDVDLAPELHDLIDHGVRLVPVRHRAVVGGGGAAELLDLTHHDVRGARFLAFTVELRSEVVDDDLRAFRGQRHRDAASDSASRPRHQCSPAVEHPHAFLSFSLCLAAVEDLVVLHAALERQIAFAGQARSRLGDDLTRSRCVAPHQIHHVESSPLALRVTKSGFTSATSSMIRPNCGMPVLSSSGV